MKFVWFALFIFFIQPILITFGSISDLEHGFVGKLNNYSLNQAHIEHQLFLLDNTLNDSHRTVLIHRFHTVDCPFKDLHSGKTFLISSGWTGYHDTFLNQLYDHLDGEEQDSQNFVHRFYKLKSKFVIIYRENANDLLYELAQFMRTPAFTRVGFFQFVIAPKNGIDNLNVELLAKVIMEFYYIVNFMVFVTPKYPNNGKLKVEPFGEN